MRVTLLATAQEASSIGDAPASADIAFHSSSDLVLVDVITFKNGLPEKTLKPGDMEVFDKGPPVSIKTFDSGAQFATRPLALWFVVLCNVQGLEMQGSGLFAAGQIGLFRPALKYVEKQDTVAVAHWYDDGQSKIDLPPTNNLQQAPTVIEQVLAPVPRAKDRDRTGELALQKTLQQIVAAKRSSKPEPLPVVIFLYGDHSGMPRREANHVIDELLETSAIVFGVRDGRSPNVGFLIDEQNEVARYIAAQPGGQNFDATPRHTRRRWRRYCSSFIFVTSWYSSRKSWTASVIS